MTSTLFPLVRHLSPPVTRALLKMPATPNQITSAAILCGVASALAATMGTQAADLACGLLLTISYVLDNSDGEVARARNMTSRFGALLDSVGDWIVHAALFSALGVGAWLRTGELLWLALGLFAALGTTINTMIVLSADFGKRRRSGEQAPAATTPENPALYRRPVKGDPIGKWLVFVFRELARADFCFIVLALAALDWLMYLLPFAAVGAQAYWIAYFAAREEKYHV